MSTLMLIQCFFFSWVSSSRTLAQDDDCRILRFKPALEGYSLQGHVLKTFKLQTEGMCEVRCFEEHNCVSYNVGSWVEDGAYRCELSNSDHDTHSEALVRQSGVTYRPTENACSKHPCSPNQICQNGFTDKRYRCISNTNEPTVVPSSAPSSPKSSSSPNVISKSTPSEPTRSTPPIQVNPSVTVNSQSITVEEGGNVTFTCTATGQPQPTIRWNKSDGLLPQSRTMISDAELSILNVSVDDSGLYICTGTNAVGYNSSAVELNVVKLSTDVSSSLLVYIGQNRKVICPIPANPHAIVLWMYNKTSTLPDGVVIAESRVLKLTSAKISHGGNYTCVVRNSSSSETRTSTTVTVHIRYPETCSIVKTNVTNVSGHYVIDSDGVGGTAPLDVYCNMTDKGGVGVTIVSHDTENRIHVDGCNGGGCYKRDVTYMEASLSQLTALTDVSSHCEQFISYECLSSMLFRNEKGWWVSRDGVRMKYWGGAGNKEGYCACGVTQTCVDERWKCNCDEDKSVWRQDSGLLTNKTHLPVSQLRFGDTGADHEEGYHILGKLKCYGTA